MVITKEKKKAMLNAITAMEQHYLEKKRLSAGDRCPICRACSSCSDCLWERIEGVSCGKMADNMGYIAGVGYLKVRRSGRWIRLRLEQLPKWRIWVNNQFIKG